MTKINRKLDASNDARVLAVSGSAFVTMAFNVGLAVFVLDGFWLLLHGPVGTSIENRLHTLFAYSGLGLAAVMWIASSRNTRWLNGLLMMAVVVVALYAGAESIRQFDASQRELMRGTVFNGRVVYSGLGLSFAVPPNWALNLQPAIIKGNSKSTSSVQRTVIQYGETAVFFHAASQSAPSNSRKIADTIQIEGGPFIFRSLGRTLGSVRQIESSYRSMTGVKIVQPMRFYELGDMDFVEFDVFDEAQQVLFRHIFARSGEVRLDFVLSTYGEQAPPRFEEFVRSIRITRTPTRFNQ